VKVCDEAIRPVQAIIRFSIVTVLGRMTRSCTCTRRLSAGLEFMIAEFNFRPLALFSATALIESKYLPGHGPILFGLTIAKVRPQTPKDCPSLSPLPFIASPFRGCLDSPSGANPCIVVPRGILNASAIGIYPIPLPPIRSIVPQTPELELIVAGPTSHGDRSYRGESRLSD
jgi:hypothetical protein